MTARVDPYMFALTYDYVGDLAETVALIWPNRPGVEEPPRLAGIVDRLRLADKSKVPALLPSTLDILDTTGRWALLKLILGGLRDGVSASRWRSSERSGMASNRTIERCSNGWANAPIGR